MRWTSIGDADWGGVPLVHLPYFLPDGWSLGIEDEQPEPRDRPYLAAAGRLVKMKGFQRLIPMMRVPPRGRPADRRHRPLRGRALRELAAGPAQRVLRGLAGRERWPGCFAVPGRWWSRRCSPRRLAMSFSRRSRCGRRSSSTRSGGALHETGVQSGGGLGYRTDIELLTALRRMIHDHDLRAELAARGFARRMGEWSETRAHPQLL